MRDDFRRIYVHLNKGIAMHYIVQSCLIVRIIPKKNLPSQSKQTQKKHTTFLLSTIYYIIHHIKWGKKLSNESMLKEVCL